MQEIHFLTIPDRGCEENLPESGKRWRDAAPTANHGESETAAATPGHPGHQFFSDANMGRDDP